MRLEDALRISDYARRPLIFTRSDFGREVKKWLVVYKGDYYSRMPGCFVVCHPDMMRDRELSDADVLRHALAHDDWEPYSSSKEQDARYVIVIKRRPKRNSS
jgi:hypothetical protein